MQTKGERGRRRDWSRKRRRCIQAFLPRSHGPQEDRDSVTNFVGRVLRRLPATTQSAVLSRILLRKREPAGAPRQPNVDVLVTFGTPLVPRTNRRRRRRAWSAQRRLLGCFLQSSARLEVCLPLRTLGVYASERIARLATDRANLSARRAHGDTRLLRTHGDHPTFSRARLSTTRKLLRRLMGQHAGPAVHCESVRP